MKVFRILSVAGLSALLATLAPAGRAQQRESSAMNSSDLALQNLRRVAATAAEIKAILLGDSGLMVELKHWVARDATDHGQIVTDLDVASDAILNRLETDLSFRAAATALLRRYGYLLPKQSMISCDRELDRDCSVPETQPAPAAAPAAQPSVGIPLPGSVPGELNVPFLPNAGENPATRERLLQTDEKQDELFPQLPPFESYGSGVSLNTLNISASPSTVPQTGEAGAARMSGVPRAGGISDSESANDGLLAAYGNVFGANAASRASLNANAAVGQGSSASLSRDTSSDLRRRPNLLQSPADSLRQPPEMIRKPNPYNDIPSLYDMYVQAVSHPAAPRRFGAEVFESGARDSQLIPMDLPVGPEYVVGPGDGLAVNLWGGISQRLYRIVDREGRVNLPEVGPMLVSGKSLAAVQQDVQQILRTQFRDVSADVSLSRLRTIRVYEVGDVNSPGAYDISSLSTPLNALFAAGGPTPRGSMRILKHYRGTQLVETVDVYDLLLHGVKKDLQRLENGDTVQVPPIGPQVTVEGMVRRPAVYELRDEKTLASVLELAGGLLPTAALRHMEVQRILAHEKQTMLNLEIPETDSDAAVTKKLEAFEIHDGDRIRIYPIVPYNQDTIYLEGHVLRPGRYSYHADMRVTDVLSSFKDLLPEPAPNYAEIVRLNPPDFHPSVEGFDLTDAIDNPTRAPVLHAMDTVRIFSRFDFENPPVVSVLGDVRQPGTYLTAGMIHLADAVHLAGGLAPDAQTTDAQVFRYLPGGKSKIFSVSLGQALAGDPAENILLQPRDRLLIHRNPDAADPATVYLQGEVARPGRYPLTSNMRVADLIRVGGGLQPGADTQQADLTKYQWSGQGQTRLNGQREVVALPAALAGDVKANAPLRNGDVLTIRQLPGWNDLGASINVKGEVKHPGTYGIRPGERLSSVLERAGGFQPDAYPFGAVLQRTQVREMETNARDEMILRVRSSQNELLLLPDADVRAKQAKIAAVQQWQEALDELSANPPLGRVTIRISSKIDRWKNSPSDIEVRANDTLVIPKTPSYVMVTGHVFNATAVSFRPGKSAKWYLSQAGGPTQVANKRAIFVIRADGSVVGAKNNLLLGESLGTALEPGDTVVVPEKALAGGVQWQSVLLSAQAASSIASAVFIALRY